MISLLDSLASCLRRWKDTPDIASPPASNSISATPIVASHRRNASWPDQQQVQAAYTLQELGILFGNPIEQPDAHSLVLSRLASIDLLLGKIKREMVMHPSNRTAVVLEVVGHIRELTHQQAMEAITPSIVFLLSEDQQDQPQRGGL